MLGQTVIYVLTESDVFQINHQRLNAGGQHLVASGGNAPYAQQPVAAVIVREWGGGLANLKLLLDGHDTFWVCSRTMGNATGQWMPLFGQAPMVQQLPQAAGAGPASDVHTSKYQAGSAAVEAGRGVIA